jgi:hypothetical protein
MGLRNVTVLGRTERIEDLYRASKVVLVPSYRFIETFSRVCIEAHRFGKPVLGSDVGNVPNLLKEAGIVLREDAAEWANELNRLFSDNDYYKSRSSAALKNSDRYSYKNQERAIHGVLNSAVSPFLLGIGSGIGNMTHISPLVRHLAEHYGKRIDIVVAEDYSDSLFLLHNPKWVNSVFSLRPTVLTKRYDTIFLTHSFGPARVQFNGKRVVWSRDWEEFSADHVLHEARFNFEAVKQLLGINYDETAIGRYYVGEAAYRRPEGKLVGVHGGSKEGFWLSKRWPYYSELAAELKKRGYRVASFGTSTEYVEGTEDRTGGNIEQMARSLCDCSYFVGNDSGVMHLANSLGIPLIALFGPTNPRTRGPLGKDSRVLSLQKQCAPCECKSKELFQSGECRCISEISLELVLAKFDELVRTEPSI